jgi:hypothetical protein
MDHNFNDKYFKQGLGDQTLSKLVPLEIFGNASKNKYPKCNFILYLKIQNTNYGNEAT